jgi:hypothetical protein
MQEIERRSMAKIVAGSPPGARKGRGLIAKRGEPQRPTLPTSPDHGKSWGESQPPRGVGLALRWGEVLLS